MLYMSILRARFELATSSVQRSVKHHITRLSQRCQVVMEMGNGKPYIYNEYKGDAIYGAIAMATIYG